MTTSPRRLSSLEAGFTLIELVVVIAVTGLVLGAVAVGLTVTWRSDDAAFQRLAKSHDAQLAATYIVNDAQSSGGTGNVSSTDPSPFTCADPSIVGSTNYTVASPAILMLKWIDTTASTTPTITVKSVDYVIVTAKSSNVTTLRRWYCVGGGLANDTTIGHYVDPANPPSATCYAANRSPEPCSANPAPRTVTVKITETKASSETSPYSYSLTGEFRQTPPGSSGTPPNAPKVPWLTLGSDDACDQPSTAIQDHTSLQVNAGGGVASNGTVEGTVQPSGTPITENPSPPILDPYRFLPIPSSPGGPYSDGQLHGPGVYTGAVSITASSTLTAGVYIFQKGLSISGNKNVKVDGTSGVLLYFPNGGTYSVSGQATVDLSAPASGTYQGVVLFEARDNPATMTVSGQGITNYNGAIYAPDATVDVSGNGGTIADVVAECGAISGNGSVTVGS
jgi:prepilin-type N-terminal cleavage/methylation domain-containing protein